jgi:hypothetical protein
MGFSGSISCMIVINLTIAYVISREVNKRRPGGEYRQIVGSDRRTETVEEDAAMEGVAPSRCSQANNQDPCFP